MLSAPVRSSEAGFSPLVREYRRRRPQDTVLHQVVLENLRTFSSLREDEGRPLPAFVRREFERYLACGDLAEGFARVHCGACGYDRLVGFSCKRRGWCPSCNGRRMNDGAAFLTDQLIGETPVRHWVLSLPHPLRFVLAYDSAVLGDVLKAFTDSIFQFLRWRAKEHLDLPSVSLAHPGCVTVIQRASSDLSLNVHFHSLSTDGVFVQEYSGGPVSFQELPPPSDGDVADVAQETCRRTRLALIRHGLWKDDVEEPFDGSPVPDELADLYAASIRGVLLMGPRRGQRVVRFFGEAARRGDDPDQARSGGAFNLHARQAVPAGDRAGLERLARYILRPPLSSTRLERRAGGPIAVTLKRPWRDGTAGVLLEPLDFLGRLAALVPPPRANIVRYHGVYAAHARLRAQVVPARTDSRPCGCERDTCPPAGAVNRPGPRLTWAELRARVFATDVLSCPRCSAPGMQMIAWIVENDIVRKVLRAVGLPTDPPVPHPARSPEDLFTGQHGD